jgi:hypothetical protein
MTMMQSFFALPTNDGCRVKLVNDDAAKIKKGFASLCRMDGGSFKKAKQQLFDTIRVTL